MLIRSRVRPSHRHVAASSTAALLVCVLVVGCQKRQPWVRYQEEFARLVSDRARTKLQEAVAEENSQETARWQRAVEKASHWRPQIRRVYPEGLRIPDRCPTCHLGIENPLFEDAPQPFRTHPGDLTSLHNVKRFGCTLCHGGQGSGTSVKAAHGQEDDSRRPLLPKAYMQSACARCHEVTHGLAGAELVTRGADLFMTKGCYGCHPTRGIRYLPKFGPPLTDLKRKLVGARNWLHAWLQDPARLTPDAAMPSFQLRKDEVGNITAFLLSLGKDPRGETLALDNASAEEGRQLFTERGCRGCHGIEPGEHSVSPRVPHLGTIGSKVTAEWLDRWIANPKAVFLVPGVVEQVDYNADTPMPKLQLTRDERRAIIGYLLTLKRAEPLPEAPPTDQFDPAAGKELVKQYECYGCHAIEGFDKVRLSTPDLAEFAKRPVADLNFGPVQGLPRTKWDWLRRKLQEPGAYGTAEIKPKMPTFSLTDDEAEALTAFVLAQNPPPTSKLWVPASASQKARRELSWMLARLNCNGCHQIAGQHPHIARLFERKSRVPPTLDGVGARLQGRYLYRYLLAPQPVRAWLTIRMPFFGFSEAQARLLVEGFAAVAGVVNPYTYVANHAALGGNVKRGFHRFRILKCIQCHPSWIRRGLPEDLDPDDLSIDLMLAKKRLRAEWLREFLARPKQLAGVQTRMPTVFYTVDGEPKVEQPERDIDDIATYLMRMSVPPEVALRAYQEKRNAEDQREQIDWSAAE